MGGYKKFKRRYPKMAKAIKYGGTALTVAKHAYTVAKTVAALVNAEKQLHQIVPSAITISSTTPLIVDVTGITQGNGLGDRKANSIALSSFRLRDMIYFLSGGGLHQQVRRMIVIDRNDVGATWNTLGDLITVSPEGLRNPLNRKRFKILRDDVIIYNTDTNGTRFSDIYFKFPVWKDKKGALQRTHVTYQDNNTYGKNHVYLIYFSNVAVGSSPPIGTTQYEFSFYDN